MSHTLLAFHGFTLNGEIMRDSLEQLVLALTPKVRVVCLNAPHACSEETVLRMQNTSRGERSLPPHLAWWNASDDGLEYHGWEETCDLVREALDRYAPASILGFSQGAILAAAIAALAQTGELPHVHCAVLVAGRLPRAARFQAAFIEPIALPSLHVWGERDTLAGSHCQELANHFRGSEREIAVWPGGHRIPTQGAAHEEMTRFLLAHA